MYACRCSYVYMYACTCIHTIMYICKNNGSIIKLFPSPTGCHVDPNCASQTGIEVDDAEACCAMRNRRSFRDPNDPDGRCTLCEEGTYVL